MIYKDFKFPFSKNSITGVDVVEDIESIRQSISNIINTKRGTLPHNPRFGSNVLNYLFTKMTPLNELRIQIEIEFALENFEPRIEIISIDVISNPDLNQYEINIIYNIKQLSISDTVLVNLSLS